MALAADGTLAYALADRADPGSATITVADQRGTPQRSAGRVTGAPDGLGDLSGFGVIALLRDGRLVFEDRAQALLGNPGASPLALTPALVNGATTTHSFVVGPAATALLLVGSPPAPHATLYSLAGGAAAEHDLAADLAPVGFGKDDQELVVAQFDRPYDPTASNGANLARTVIGYGIQRLGGALQAARLPPATALVSAPVGGWAVAESSFADAPTFNVVDLYSGRHLPVQLPGWRRGEPVAVALIP